jgi:LacI family transcriptional regulator
MSRIKEVARLAGVSTATVSRVINNQPYVSHKLRERVLHAIKELDYHPSNIARSMRKQHSKIIGIVIPDIENPFFTSVVRGIEDVANQHLYKVFLCNSDRSPEKEKMYLEVLAMERISGAIVVPYMAESYHPLQKLNIPFVFINQTLPGLKNDSVVLDNFNGAYQATKHLIDLGHTRIGLINAPYDRPAETQRLIGYQKALLDSGIEIDHSIIIASTAFTPDKAEIATDQLLENQNRPTAIFSLNNYMTLGALKSLSSHKLRIPDDISVVGFDDMPWLSFFSPPITVVEQPTYLIGERAAKLLISRMEKEELGEPKNLILDPVLIVRRSTSSPAA